MTEKRTNVTWLMWRKRKRAYKRKPASLPAGMLPEMSPEAKAQLK